MNAVERVTEYSPLRAEAEGQQEVLHVPLEWPSKGAIEVQDLVVSDLGPCMGPLLVCPGEPAVVRRYVAGPCGEQGSADAMPGLTTGIHSSSCPLLRLTRARAAQQGDYQVQAWVSEQCGQARWRWDSCCRCSLLQVLREWPRKEAVEVQWGNSLCNSISWTLLLCRDSAAEEVQKCRYPAACPGHNVTGSWLACAARVA